MRVVELFAGVGGFRRGLELTGSFDTVWFNQWEPSTKVQHAYDCYVQNFMGGSAPPAGSNHDIFQVTEKEMELIPEHDLLVGGFPCQDYSVATTLDKSGGLDGKKGRLWWAIDDILTERRPKYVLLENVNTLLTKPSKQRGRAFGVILSCFNKLGYNVEWRVLNAAEHGQYQRRRRVFIFAARADTAIGQKMAQDAAMPGYLVQTGFFAKAFPVAFTTMLSEPSNPSGSLKDPVWTSKHFSEDFQNSGVMANGAYWTRRVDAATGEAAKLIDVLLKDVKGLDVDEKMLPQWEYVKGSKREKRVTKEGFEYFYTEGKMGFPDRWDTPSRTLLTGEASRTPNRSTHVVKDPGTGKLRFLHPVECERLNGFPDDWTSSIPTRWRYFTMGNALVVPLVTEMGRRLLNWEQELEQAPQKRSKLKVR